MLTLCLHVLRCLQASKRLQAKNNYLNDLKMASAEAKKSKATDNEKLSASYDTTIVSFLKHYDTSNKVSFAAPFASRLRAVAHPYCPLNLTAIVSRRFRRRP